MGDRPSSKTENLLTQVGTQHVPFSWLRKITMAKRAAMHVFLGKKIKKNLFFRTKWPLVSCMYHWEYCIFKI